MNADVIVEVLPGSVKERKGEFTNDAGDKVAYETRSQDGKLECNGFAYPYTVRLEKDQPEFKPGRYRLSLEKMLTVNKGAHFLAKFPVLEPLVPAK